MHDEPNWEGRWRLAGDMDNENVVQKLLYGAGDGATYLWLDSRLHRLRLSEYREKFVITTDARIESCLEVAQGENLDPHTLRVNSVDRASFHETFLWDKSCGG